MKNLWSPWRSQYIDSFKSNDTKIDCIFCAAKNLNPDDPENLVIKKSAHTFSMLNLYPYNNGHTMIIPYRHTGEFNELTADESNDIMNELKLIKAALTEIFKPHGFNIGANLGRVSGAGIEDHIHFHIVPRWNGDTNFMPVLGEVKIISEDLLVTKSKMKNYFDGK